MLSLFVRRVLPLLLLGTLGLSSCVATYPSRGYYAPGPPRYHHHGYGRPVGPPPGYYHR